MAEPKPPVQCPKCGAYRDASRSLTPHCPYCGPEDSKAKSETPTVAPASESAPEPEVKPKAKVGGKKAKEKPTAE